MKQTARLAYDWLLNSATPMGEYGYMKMQRGLPDDAKIPNDEWPTRELVLMVEFLQKWIN